VLACKLLVTTSSREHLLCVPTPLCPNSFEPHRTRPRGSHLTKDLFSYTLTSILIRTLVCSFPTIIPMTITFGSRTFTCTVKSGSWWPPRRVCCLIEETTTDCTKHFENKKLRFVWRAEGTRIERASDRNWKRRVHRDGPTALMILTMSTWRSSDGMCLCPYIHTYVVSLMRRNNCILSRALHVFLSPCRQPNVR
jgi:hypothetical protein